MGFALTPDGIRAEQVSQAELNKAIPGHAADSPGAHPPPRRAGELAVGHPVSDEPPGGDPFDPGHFDTHMWLQPPLHPRDFPEIRPILPNDASGSSISDHGLRHVVPVQQFQAAEASQVEPLPGNPSGDPSQRRTADQQMHTAPSGFGQQFRENGKRPSGNPYLPVPGEGNR